MKLATYIDGSRDGQLVVVSRDLSTAHYATGIASKLQQVLDDWNFLSPQLQDLYDALNRSAEGGSAPGMARHAFPFDPMQCMAPLPRAYQRVAGPSDPHQLASLQHSSGAELAGPCDDVVCVSGELAIGFDASIAVITGDVARGVAPQQALDGIRMLMLVCDLNLRQLKPGDPAAPIESVQSGLASAFSPVAVTLDECGSAWVKGRLHLTLETRCNGRALDPCEIAGGMTFHFGQIIAQLCKYRQLRSGCIVGCGPLGNNDGKLTTHLLNCGDTVWIGLKGSDGKSLLGAIELRIAAPAKAVKT
jgi:fumarylacetoacetate (FAA) hydrolase